MAQIFFITAVILIYLLVNYYIFSRGMQALPAFSVVRSVFPWVFWTLAATYIIGRILERVYISGISDLLIWVGSFWLGAMFYFFLAVIIIDLFRLINYLFPFYPSFITTAYEQTKQAVLIIVVVAVASTILLGHINTLLIKVNKVEVPIEKEAGELTNLRAVLISDIHLGTLIGRRTLEKITEKTIALEPDIIFLAGDILDQGLEPVLRHDLGGIFNRLTAPMGVYAVMGNHEHISGAEQAYAFLGGQNITILRDSVIKVNESFYVIGREDRDKAYFSNEGRKSLDQLLGSVDQSFPLILVDHQPYYLQEAAERGVDLQLSGHTHHGQLWPINLITSAIFTISRGYGVVNGMHVYVSSGAGTWGPPVRIGSRPEIVKINITFGKHPQH